MAYKKMDAGSAPSSGTRKKSIERLDRLKKSTAANTFPTKTGELKFEKAGRYSNKGSEIPKMTKIKPLDAQPRRLKGMTIQPIKPKLSLDDMIKARSKRQKTSA